MEIAKTPSAKLYSLRSEAKHVSHEMLLNDG